jgi:hypothetical protein
MKVYVIEWLFGRSIHSSKRVLVLDERERGSKQLPSITKLRGNREEYEKQVIEVCREINEMRYSRGMSWGEIADTYGVTKPVIRGFYQRHCSKRKLRNE